MKYILSFLKALEDPRQAWKVKHLLSDILAICIIAIMCGAKSSWDIREYAVYREEWLRKFLPLYNGIPSRLTFERVLRILDPKRFAAVFTQIMQGVQTLSKGEIVSLDGKKYFKSAKVDGTIKPLYMVSAWCSHIGLSQGSVDNPERNRCCQPGHY